MIQTRQSVFETNSSMTHSLVICKQSDYEAWTEGKMMFRMADRSFLPNDKALKVNGKELRKSVKEAKKQLDLFSDGVGYWTKLLNKLTEENISKYETGEKPAKKFEFYNYYNSDYFYITYKEWIDYVINHLNLCDMHSSDNIDGAAIAVFGYYGHD